jgi:hypothetical protein
MMPAFTWIMFHPAFYQMAGIQKKFIPRAPVNMPRESDRLTPPAGGHTLGYVDSWQ